MKTKYQELRRKMLDDEPAFERMARHTKELTLAHKGEHPDPFVQHLYNTGVDVTHRWSDFQKMNSLE